ncbi:hypothetical protein Trco_000832 [Trichoderma cornu-damae]|uniref:F-box domain-containing protein n=1 Tax=Trichoderma cornu-damae TaxID=654480 RepID=A0A9P8QY47_9HYPO|nr:hypothetical protein Trco_000832 [Trichoderma cornu-damae]
MSLGRIPREILQLIAVNLDPDDLFHLAISSRRFQHVIHDSGICRRVLENLKFSPDYKQGRDTGDYARALRRLVKRREAVQVARPFQVLEVSKEAVHFTYANGAVCYTTKRRSPSREHHLRILLLQGPSVKEVSIDVLRLIEAADVPGFEENRPYQFRPLYHAHGIVSCLYEQKRAPASGRWLIIYSLKERKILDSRSLRSTANIFVRNNDHFLYYGTRSEPADGQRRWVLCGFSLKESRWLAPRIMPRDLVGSDIGSSICFEIFGDHLYGVSNQELTKWEDMEWGSKPSEGWSGVACCEMSPEDGVHRGDNGFSSSTFDFANSPVRSGGDAEKGSEDREVRFWPAGRGDEWSDEPLDHYIEDLLNPRARFDEVDWAMDEKVLVYSPKPFHHLDEPRPIVLISFDPALHFPGLCRWGGGSKPPCLLGEIGATEPPRIRGLDLSFYVP